MYICEMMFIVEFVLSNVFGVFFRQFFNGSMNSFDVVFLMYGFGGVVGVSFSIVLVIFYGFGFEGICDVEVFI